MENLVNKAVIFDLDGTLIDSMKSFDVIVRSKLEKKGIQITSEGINDVGHQLLEQSQKNHSKTGFKLIFYIFWTIGRISGLNFLQASIFSISCISEVRKVYKSAPLFPEVKECLSKLSSQGFCLGICTTASRKQLNKILQKYDLKQYFCQDSLITRDDVKRVKPDSEGLLIAIEACSASPKHSYFLGDMPSDIKAGNEVKMTTIGLTTGLLKKSLLLQYSDPSEVFDSLEQATAWILHKDQSDL